MNQDTYVYDKIPFNKSKQIEGTLWSSKQN